MKKTIDNAVLLTLITAFLYTASIAHLNGYLWSLGIESDFISRTTESILYHSIFVVGFPLIALGIILILAFGLVGALLLKILKFISDSYKIKRFLVKKRKKVRAQNIKTFGKMEYILTQSITYITKIFISLIILFVVMAFFEDQGKKKAKTLLEKISQDNYKDKILINNIDNKELYIIDCGINNCVGIDVSSKKIIYFEKKVNNFTSSLKPK